MPLESSCCRLRDAYLALTAGLNDLYALAGDHPARSEPAPVGRLRDTLDKALGLAAEGAAASAGAAAAAAHPADAVAAGQALVAAHQRYEQFWRLYQADVISKSRLDQFARMSRERAGGWEPWAAQMIQALEAEMVALYEVGDGLLACWAEVVDRIASTAISVRTEAIGQQITVPSASEIVPAMERVG